VSNHEFFCSAPPIRYKRGTNSRSLPFFIRFDGMALNHVHYTVGVRELCPPKRRALDRRWKIERTVSRACSTDWRVLPPARPQGLRTPQHFRVHQLGAKSARSRSSSEAGMSAQSSSPAASALTSSFPKFLFHGY